ncbi:DUF4627 domain-containing protein [Sphingobacterium paucimobilis]|uniref:DUF4627 domain-containing protein n=1 Tax=Sphingobacterium paucimobilis HER1398 TaxID=1346330 RepID=U2HVY7_9SPHI|nr:DUF4627 domain-containing protein [Sphingobacterium paucimobilis]ERJ59687.1 hypothetical protein M472_12980 [Sphingobacterium paucimobilis HER1398]
MKKLSSLICLIVLSISVYAQENLIVDGKFEQSSFSVNDINRKIPGAGKWFPYLTSDKQAVMSVIKDTEKGNAASIQTLSSVSYAYSFIGQRVDKAPAAGIYTVTFWAKATHEVPTYFGIYIKANAPKGQTLYFPLQGFDPQETPSRSGALRQSRITNEWKEYSVDFDLSKVVNAVASPKVAKEDVVLSASTDEHRKLFDLSIACMTKNSGMLFTDVSLTKKN